MAVKGHLGWGGKGTKMGILPFCGTNNWNELVSELLDAGLFWEGGKVGPARQFADEYDLRSKASQSLLKTWFSAVGFKCAKTCSARAEPAYPSPLSLWRESFQILLHEVGIHSCIWNKIPVTPREKWLVLRPFLVVHPNCIWVSCTAFLVLGTCARCCRLCLFREHWVNCPPEVMCSNVVHHTLNEKILYEEHHALNSRTSTLSCWRV